MTTRTLLPILVATVLLVAPERAVARSERGCQAVLAGTGAQLLDRSMAILAACRTAVVRGKRPASTDCLADPATTRKRAAAEEVAARRIRAACSDAIVTSLMPGGDCAGAHTAAALADCVVGSHAADANTLIGVAGAGGAPASSSARACQEEALRRARRFSLARLRVLQQCKRKPPADLRPGTECAAHPRVAARIAQLRVAARTPIVARCGIAALAGTRFAIPCAAPASGERLADCLLDVASTTGDDALAAEYRDTGFCGDASAAVERRIDGLLARMMLAEKLEQMHGIALSVPRLSGRTASNDRLGIPGIAMIDGPRGVSAIAGHA